jgi:hypothetical protein
MSYLKPYYLCTTSGLSIIGLIIYIFYNNKNLEKNILATALFLCIVMSQLFWINPIQHSVIHKIDALVAKFSIFLFICYTLFYKKISHNAKFLYILLGVLTIFVFYRSDYFSCKEWCSDGHLFNHGLLHISCFIATLYVFL